jgi:hypothetical protein
MTNYEYNTEYKHKNWIDGKLNLYNKLLIFCYMVSTICLLFNIIAIYKVYKSNYDFFISAMYLVRVFFFAFLWIICLIFCFYVLLKISGVKKRILHLQKC